MACQPPAPAACRLPQPVSRAIGAVSTFKTQGLALELNGERDIW
jgi:hypothetical protein